MDLKKIMALAMIALLALPSLTMAVMADEPIGDPEDGAGLVDSIARARLYLGKVRDLADNIDEEYPNDEMIQGYLDDIYNLLGQDWEEDPEILLETNGDIGDEDRIVITMPSDFTLGDLDTLSWLVKTESGYPPHVDITLDTLDTDQSMLTAELAVNNPSYSPPTYGTYDTWLETFEMASDDGYDEIDDTTVLWVTKMGAGDQDAPSSTLANWKLGIIDKDPGSELSTTVINSETQVLMLEIEVDNWIVQTKAYVDDIKINGEVYDDEEEPEGLGAEGFLDRASFYFGEGEFNSAARNLAAARNILGRVKGLLNKIAKAHKVTRTERFMEQVKHRINGITDKIDKLSGRLDVNKANKVKAAMGNAWGNIPQLGDNPSDDDVTDAIDSLEITIASINAALVDLGGDTSDILEAMDRLEAKIRVLKASSERLARKGSVTSDVDAELNSVEDILEEMMTSLVDGDTETAENLLEDAEDIVSEASENIRRNRKEHQNKSNKGKRKGQTD